MYRDTTEWNMKCMILPVITGTTEKVTEELKKSLEVVIGKYLVESVQHRIILGTSHILWKVLLFLTGNLSHCDHSWFKRNTGEEGAVTRKNIVVVIVVENKM